MTFIHTRTCTFLKFKISLRLRLNARFLVKLAPGDCQLSYSLKVVDKGRDLTQSYDKNIYHKTRDNTNTPPKLSVTQRLRTDFGRYSINYCHPTSVVKPVYGNPTVPLAKKPCNQKDTLFFLIVNNYPYR